MKKFFTNKVAIGAVVGFALAQVGTYFGVDLADQQEAIGTGLGLVIGGVWTCVDRINAKHGEIDK